MEVRYILYDGRQVEQKPFALHLASFGPSNGPPSLRRFPVFQIGGGKKRK